MSKADRHFRRAIVSRPAHFLALAVSLLMSLALLPVAPIRSQQPPKISVEVKVVTVLATVRDKHGKIVSNLGKDDFTLDEDGRPQRIGYFSRETDLPLSLGLLIDTSESQRRVLNQERTASDSFLADLLRENKDVAFVIHFDREVELLQDLTSSREKLKSALALVDTPQLNRRAGGNGRGAGSRGNGGNDGDEGNEGSDGNSGPRSRFAGGGTLLYDAVYLASDEVIRKQQGRKALIVLSDGVDRGSKESLETAIMTAQRADTVVYSILVTDERQNQRPFSFGGPGSGGRGGGRRYPQQERPDGKKILERISRETGGHLFEVSKKQPVGDIFQTIAEELRNQYSLGYTPDKTDAAAGYRKIHLATKQKDLVVQARDRYYADR